MEQETVVEKLYALQETDLADEGALEKVADAFKSSLPFLAKGSAQEKSALAVLEAAPFYPEMDGNEKAMFALYATHAGPSVISILESEN